jgi:hypothetical protein
VTDGRRGRLPTFVIVGAQKSGTTSLLHYLGGHPEVFTYPREAHFFDRHFERGVGWYRDLFADAGAAAALGESTPEYMYDRRAPSRMAGTIPGARLIAILRDPVDRAYSHYWHNRTRGHEPLSFAEAVEAEDERLRDPDEVTRARFGYLDCGRYLSQLELLTSTFSRESLRVVLFEDLRANRLAVVQYLYRFLGVNDTVVPTTLAEVKNRFVTFRSPRLRGPIRRLPSPLRRVAGRMNIRYVRYPPMESDIRTALQRRFEDERRALAAWLGNELAGWGRGSQR